MTNGGYNMTNRMEKLAERRNAARAENVENAAKSGHEEFECRIRFNASHLMLEWNRPDDVVKEAAVAIDGLTRDFTYMHIETTGADVSNWKILFDECLKYVGFRVRFLENEYDSYTSQTVYNPLAMPKRRIKLRAIRSYDDKITIGFRDEFTYDKFELFEIHGYESELKVETEDFQTTVGSECVGREYRVIGYVKNEKTGLYEMVGLSDAWTCKPESVEIGYPKISVVIPTYNVGWFLSRTLDTVIMQSFRDFEIICVDDASTDGKTREILAWYEHEYSFIKTVLLDVNRGPSHARCVGMDKAEGEYVVIMDSDDMIRFDMYEKLYEPIQKHGVDVAICQTLRREAWGKTDTILSHPNADRCCVYTYDQMVDMIESSDTIYFCSMCNKMMRTKIARTVNAIDKDSGFDDRAIYEDVAWTASAYSYADMFAMINEPMYVWEQRQRQTTGSFSIINEFGIKRLWKQRIDAIEFFLKAGSKKRKDDVNYQVAIDIIEQCEKLNVLEARTEIQKAVLSRCAKLISEYEILECSRIKQDEKRTKKLKAVVEKAAEMNKT